VTLLRRLRPLHSGGADDGFTLVELLAALVVMTIAFTALAGALIASIAGTAAAATVSAGNQLAAERIEALRTITWDELGHYSDEPEWGDGRFGGESLVEVADTTPTPRPAGVPLLAPQTTEIRGVTYSVTTRVTWAGSSAAAPNDGTTYAQKRLSVDVTWTTRGKTRTTSQEGLRAPNSKEMKPPATVAGVTISLANAAATPNQTLDAAGLLTQPVLLRVDTSIAAETVIASYLLASGNAASEEMTADATQRFWTLTLPVGSGPFPTGTVTFTFTATHSTGSTASATAGAEFAAATGAFALTDASSTTTISQLGIGYFLAAPIALSVKASQTASGVEATYPLSDGSTGGPIALTYDGVTSSWVGEIPLGAGPVTPGNLTVTYGGTATAGGTATTTSSVTLQAPTLGAISILKPTVVPPFCADAKSPFKLHRTSVATVEILNVDATSTAVSMALNGGAAVAATALGTTGPSGGQLFKVSYTNALVLNTTSAPLVVSVSRSADGAVATQSWTYPVTRKNSSAAC
jgi:prepilin-type N-terminal cleavage/methylation domain-containing protein